MSAASADLRDRHGLSELCVYCRQPLSLAPTNYRWSDMHAVCADRWLNDERLADMLRDEDIAAIREDEDE